MTITILWWHAPALVTALLFVVWVSLRRMPYILLALTPFIMIDGLVWAMAYGAHRFG